MKLQSVREGWRIALDQLRANKLRSALTVLGVVIGIATVMAMASIVAGFREQIVNTLEVVGPTTFRVLRYFSTTGDRAPSRNPLCGDLDAGFPALRVWRESHADPGRVRRG